MDDAVAVSIVERGPMQARLALAQLALAILTIALTPILFRLSELDPPRRPSIGRRWPCR
jgi:hypothetical protein